MVIIIMGDPGRSHDPFAIVGIELDMKTGKIRPRLARQFIKTKYGVVASYLLTIRQKLHPQFLGIETNNRGKSVQKLFHKKYNLKVAGIFTSSHLTEQTRQRGESMDKPYMVNWLKNYINDDMIEFPENPGDDMRELENQLGQIVSIPTLSGGISYKAQRGRHDDLFMALLLCCHIARLYLSRQEMIE